MEFHTCPAQTLLQQEDVIQDRHALLDLMKSCGKKKDLAIARRIHTELLLRNLFPTDVCINNSLLNMYAKCGAFQEAREIFDKLLYTRNVVSWNAMISIYIQYGLPYEAFRCFKQMVHDGFAPNSVTFSSLLKVCSTIGCLQMGEEIHEHIKKKDLFRKDIVLSTSLVDMYVKCGKMKRAQEIFDEMPKRNIVTWSVMIAGYAQHGLPDEALRCFRKMQYEGISPNAITFSCILKACRSHIEFLQVGEEIDAEIRKQGLLAKDIVLGNALIDMYMKCGMMEKAKDIFIEIPEKDVVSWSTLISGYAEHGFANEALNCFKKMCNAGISPNAFTFSTVLKACGSIGNIQMGKEIHNEVKRKQLLEKDSMLGSVLVDMYAKCGLLGKAQEIFEGLRVKDIVSWSALIAGYTHNGLYVEALKCYLKMQNEGVSPNEFTFSCVLKACACVGALEVGEEIHVKVNEEGLLQDNTILGTGLVDMYAKCGLLERSHEVFEKLHIRNITSWNALVSGYAQVGKIKNVLNLFSKMLSEGIVPDVITNLVVMTTFCHGGLVEEGQSFFHDMGHVYHLDPTLEHYACMVDLFTHAGHFDKALVLIENVSYFDRLPLWLALLSACCKWRYLDLGKFAFNKSIELDARCHTAYVNMGNLYASGSYSLVK